MIPNLPVANGILPADTTGVSKDQLSATAVVLVFFAAFHAIQLSESHVTDDIVTHCKMIRKEKCYKKQLLAFDVTWFPLLTL